MCFAFIHKVLQIYIQIKNSAKVLRNILFLNILLWIRIPLILTISPEKLAEILTIKEPTDSCRHCCSSCLTFVQNDNNLNQTFQNWIPHSIRPAATKLQCKITWKSLSLVTQDLCTVLYCLSLLLSFFFTMACVIKFSLQTHQYVLNMF